VSNLKKWPANGDLPDMRDLLTPLRKVLRKGEYEGYEIGARERCMETDPDKALSPEGLERAREDGDIRASVVLRIAFQLGAEQGRRQVKRELREIIEGRVERGKEVDADTVLRLLSSEF
jgi:hypothetical protein